MPSFHIVTWHRWLDECKYETDCCNDDLHILIQIFYQRKNNSTDDDRLVIHRSHTTAGTMKGLVRFTSAVVGASYPGIFLYPNW